MGNSVDPLRHASVFSPDAFGDKRIDIIGAGATGSRIAIEIARLGVTNMHVWDFDTIAEHNIANQAFSVGDVGRPKVEALAEHIRMLTGLEITQHNEAVTGRTSLGRVVFLLTDTMSSRKEIFEGAIRYKPAIDLMIETRMGKDEGRVYTVRPTIPADIRRWESTLCEDEEASESLCGARTTIGATAALVTAHAVWAFLRFYRWQTGAEGQDQPELEHMFYANPPMTMVQ